MGEPNTYGLADAPSAEAGTTYRNTGSSDFKMVGSQNEQTKREARVAWPMNCVAVPEVARQEAMFTTHCDKSVRGKFIGRTAGKPNNVLTHKNVSAYPAVAHKKPHSDE